MEPYHRDYKHCRAIFPENPFYFSAFSAIDDIRLDPKECWEVATTVAPTGTPKPDIELTCDFEDGSSCGWSISDIWDLETGHHEEGTADGPFVDDTTKLSSG